MSISIENFRNYKTFTEAYELVKTVELVMDVKEYRIEILKSYSDNAMPYFSKTYVYEAFKVESNYPIDPFQNIGIWKEISHLLPYIQNVNIDLTLVNSLEALVELKKQIDSN